MNSFGIINSFASVAPSSRKTQLQSIRWSSIGTTSTQRISTIEICVLTITEPPSIPIISRAIGADMYVTILALNAVLKGLVALPDWAGQCQDSLRKMHEDFRRNILEYNDLDFLHRVFNLKNSGEPGIFRESFFILENQEFS